MKTPHPLPLGDPPWLIHLRDAVDRIVDLGVSYEVATTDKVIDGLCNPDGHVVIVRRRPGLEPLIWVAHKSTSWSDVLLAGGI